MKYSIIIVSCFYSFLGAAQADDDLMKLLWCDEVLSSSEESEDESRSGNACVHNNAEILKHKPYTVNPHALKRQRNFFEKYKADYEKVREEPRPFLYCVCRVVHSRETCNTFVPARNIKKHIISHCSEKPYTCSSCTKKYTFLSEVLECLKKDIIVKSGLLR